MGHTFFLKDKILLWGMARKNYFGKFKHIEFAMECTTFEILGGCT